MRRLLLVLGLLLLMTAPAHAAGRAGFGWPLAGTPAVARGFERPSTAYGAGHRGVDLTAAVGQSVLAAGAGRVAYAGLLAGRGIVTVTHASGLRTTYEPVSPSVRVGQAVGLGAVLGTLTRGHASCRLGTHCLHWGLLRGQTYLDPLSLVVTTEVRLLPLGPAPAPVARVAGLQTAASPRGRSWVRATGAIVAAGALATGVGLLSRPVRRPVLVPPAAPATSALEERRRRRAA